MKKILSIIISALMLLNISVYAEETAMNAELSFVTEAMDLNLTAPGEFKAVYSVYNKSITDRINGVASYVLSDENGDVLWSNEADITVPAGSVKKFECIGSVSKYGVHLLTVSITDKNTGKTLTGTKEISLSVNNTTLNETAGVSAHFAWSSNPNSTISYLGKMGSKFVRDEIYWKNYELEKGVYKLPQKADEYVTMLVENGIEPLIILDFGNKLYTENDDAYPSDNEQIKAYGDYVYNLVKDLKGRVRYFEVWNEFNLSGDGATYAKILKTAYTRAKEANPDCIIVGPVTAGTSNTFFLNMKREVSDIDKYIDILSFHEYYKQAPETDEYESTLKYCVKTLKNYFGSDKEVWLTEMGWSEGEEGITEKDAAIYTVRHFLNNYAEKIADKMFIYSWINHSGHSKPYEANLGLLNGDCSAKKGYVAMSAMNYFLSGFSYNNRVIDSSNNYTYTFKKGDNREVIVVYNANNNVKTVTVTPEFEEASVYDMYANKIRDLSGAEAYDIAVSGEPIYIVGRKSTAVMNYQENKAEIFGEIEGASADEQVMLYVTNPGVGKEDILSPENLVYIEQLSLGANGSYEFSFPMDKSAGIYNIWIGHSDSPSIIGPVSLEVRRDVEGYTIVCSGEKELKTLADIIASEGVVTVNGVIDNKYNALLNAMLYVVGIKDSRPAWIDKNDGIISGYGKQEVDITLDRQLVSDVDEIRLYLWQEDMIPVAERTVISD